MMDKPKKLVLKIYNIEQINFEEKPKPNEKRKKLKR